MEQTQQRKIWPWIAGACSLLVILACIVTTAIGTGGFLLANRVVNDRQDTNKPVLIDEVSPESAVLQSLQGWVEVTDGTGTWSPAFLGQVITTGQRIRTGKLSSASLIFNDGSQALLKEDTEIQIDQLNAEPNGKPRTIVMTQIAGESTHQVVPNQNGDSRYEVLTTASAGLAKGTEFDVIVTPENTAYFYVVEGTVAVTAVQTTVLVHPGFMTLVYFEQPPVEPVQTITVEGLVSQIGSQWTVAVTTFTADEETLFAGDVQVGDWAIIKGHLDENNQNIADWVILLRRSLTNRFSMTGTVEVIDTGMWTVNGQNIVITELTEHDPDIQIGDMVYVKGLIAAGGALEAHEIQRIDEESGMPFDFSGIVQETDKSLWVISDVTVETDITTVITEGLQPGDMVRVRGRILPSGIWLAQEITLQADEDNEFSFTGELESLDPWKVAGITFEIREDTVIEAGLSAGEMVRVEGIIDSEGVWIATRIERIDVDAVGSMVIVGAVISIDPWVVSGIPFALTPDAQIGEGITVGMLVRVELVLQPDGTWMAIRIDPISTMIWFPGCMDVVATVVGVAGNQLTLLNWPVLTVAEGATIEGALTPNSVIRMRVCFTDAMIIQITYIIIIQPGDIEQPEGDVGGKVSVCHKPGGKKGGHTISISRSALPAHLAHGDYEGACR